MKNLINKIRNGENFEGITNLDYRRMVDFKLKEPYYDDGWTYYGKLLAYQKRQYRSWKHNREKQYKNPI